MDPRPSARLRLAVPPVPCGELESLVSSAPPPHPHIHCKFGHHFVGGCNHLPCGHQHFEVGVDERPPPTELWHSARGSLGSRAILCCRSGCGAPMLGGIVCSRERHADGTRRGGLRGSGGRRALHPARREHLPDLLVHSRPMRCRGLAPPGKRGPRSASSMGQLILTTEVPPGAATGGSSSVVSRPGPLASAPDRAAAAARISSSGVGVGQVREVRPCPPPATGMPFSKNSFEQAGYVLVHTFRKRSSSVVCFSQICTMFHSPLQSQRCHLPGATRWHRRRRRGGMGATRPTTLRSSTPCRPPPGQCCGCAPNHEPLAVVRDTESARLCRTPKHWAVCAARQYAQQPPKLGDICQYHVDPCHEGHACHPMHPTLALDDRVEDLPMAMQCRCSLSQSRYHVWGSPVRAVQNAPGCSSRVL